MSTNGSLAAKAAVAGIGATEFSKDSGRTEMRMATEAVKAALDDAGLAPADVTVGMPVEVSFVAVDDELTLPLFRPVQ